MRTDAYGEEFIPEQELTAEELGDHQRRKRDRQGRTTFQRAPLPPVRGDGYDEYDPWDLKGRAS
jgi:hypothetical protein